MCSYLRCLPVTLPSTTEAPSGFIKRLVTAELLDLSGVICRFSQGRSTFLDISMLTVRTSSSGCSHKTFPSGMVVSRTVPRISKSTNGRKSSGWMSPAAHTRFKGVDWAKVFTRELPPPYVPKVRGEDDTSMFDK